MQNVKWKREREKKSRDSVHLWRQSGRRVQAARLFELLPSLKLFSHGYELTRARSSSSSSFLLASFVARSISDSLFSLDPNEAKKRFSCSPRWRCCARIIVNKRRNSCIVKSAFLGRHKQTQFLRALLSSLHSRGRRARMVEAALVGRTRWVGKSRMLRM